MSDNPLSPLDPLRDRTPARILAGRSGTSYRTATWLGLRADHAAARDAVHAEVDLLRDLGEKRIADYLLFNVNTRATSKAEFLRRPDLGRKLAEESRGVIRARCPVGRDIQVVIGDGLSASAVAAQAGPLLDGLAGAVAARGWSFGRPFLVRYCRVGVMNEIGDILSPAVVVLLIGERPGLATAESLSAYLAYRPRTGHTDADRNLVSNIHARGVGVADAVRRVAALIERFRSLGRSGVGVTESLESPALSAPGS